MSYTHTPLSHRSKDFRIKQTEELLYSASIQSTLLARYYMFTLYNPQGSTSGTEIVSPTSHQGYLEHTTGVFGLDEGDYIIECEVVWRHSSTVMPTNYSTGGSLQGSLSFGKHTNIDFRQGVSRQGYNFDADGTFSQIGSDIYYKVTTANSGYNLIYQHKLKCRIENMPIIPDIVGYNWGSYQTYSRGTQVDMFVQKFPLYTLS